MALVKTILLVLLLESCSAQRQDSKLQEIVPSVVIRGTGDGTCPAQEVMDEQRNATKSNVQQILDARYPCACGGSGEWSRIAYLNMTDSTQQCPSSWRLHITPVRGCGRVRNSACDSAIFPANGRTYSRVCGRVIAYQKGSTDAFKPSLLTQRSVNDIYIDGVSLTHGGSGSRHHIWSFVSAIYEQDTNYRRDWNCACTNTGNNWPHTIPSFVGNDYFCDTGNPGPGFDRSAYYTDDPLWDGQGCGPTNDCCELNNPPWFCKKLPESTSDDIELRICSDQPRNNEDTVISLVEIHVQ